MQSKTKAITQKVLNLNFKLLIIFLYTTQIVGQAKLPDSLLLVIKNKNTLDTSKVNAYNQLSKYYTSIDSRDGLKYGYLANKLAKKSNYEKGLAKSYAALGSFYFYFNNNIDSLMYFMDLGLAMPNKNNYREIYGELLKKKGVGFYYKGTTDSAVAYFKSSLVQYEKLKDSFEVIKALNNIGSIYAKQLKYNEAITYFYRCLKFDEIKHDSESIATDYNNIAIVLTDKKDFKSALNYLNKSLKIRTDLKDSNGVARLYLNIVNIYIDELKYKEGIEMLQTGVSLIDTTKERDLYTKFLNNLGIIHLRTKNYHQALSYFLNDIRIKNDIGATDNLSAVYGNIGSLYAELKEYKKAIPNCIKGYELAVKSGELDIQRNCQKILARSYALTDEGDKAVEAMKLYTGINDSIYHLNLDKQITETQIKYETDKKEQENKSLSQLNELNETKLIVRNRTILILIAGLVIIISIVLWRINAIRLKKKQLELESTQKIQKEKQRISRDLHDNVGGQLSYVLYSLDDIDTSDINKRTEVKTNINDSIRSVIQNLRETIWAINDEDLSINDISDKLKVYARTMFKNTSTKIIFSEKINQNIKYNALVGLNLYRICQEIINNAFKYSKATELKISITTDSKTTISLSDNGVGFDKHQTTDGFGLTNIKSRASETGVQLTVVSETNKGVSYTLIV